jgi:hypothetical protein
LPGEIDKRVKEINKGGDNKKLLTIVYQLVKSSEAVGPQGLEMVYI